MEAMSVIANFMFQVDRKPCPLETGFDDPEKIRYYRGQVSIPEWMPSVVWNKFAQHRAEKLLMKELAYVPRYHKLTIIIFKPSVD